MTTFHCSDNDCVRHEGEEKKSENDEANNFCYYLRLLLKDVLFYLWMCAVLEMNA